MADLKEAQGDSGIQAVIFDIDGVLTESDRPVAGAVRVVAAFKEAGVPVRFLTNTTSRGHSHLAKDLVRSGFNALPDEVFCPSRAAGEYLRERGASARLLVREGALDDFEGVSPKSEVPDAVVVGDLAHEWSFDLMNEAFRLVHEVGAELIGLGRTRYWKMEDELQLDAGPFITALEYATGKDALIFGKPDPAIFEAVIADIGLPAGQIAMVGDDILSDVDAAMKVGLIGIQVRTGKFCDSDLEGTIVPNAVIDSVASLLNAS
jgi:phospholysine phosphohistidine inorganic pyrophosphate phosphatase